MRGPRFGNIRSPYRRFQLQVVMRGAAGLLLGALAAGTVVALDRLTGLTLPLPPSNARAILAALAGGILSIAVFVLWMRTVVVGLLSSQISPRVLAGYLDDAFQLNMTAWLMAAFTYLCGVALGLPSSGEGQGSVPAVSLATSMLVAVTALGTVLVAMRNASGSMELPRIVHALADRALDVLHSDRWPDDPVPTSSGDGDVRGTVRSHGVGWVQHIDHQTILQRLPPHATLRVRAEVSEFVERGDVLATVDEDVDEQAADGIRRAFVVLPVRAAEHDLRYALQQLVDVAEHATTPASTDTSTAYESLMYLRVVLRRILEEGITTGALCGDDNRRIVSPNKWQPADYLQSVLSRLVPGAARVPTTADDLLMALRHLEHTAREVGDEASLAIICDQQGRLQNTAGPLAGRRR